MYLRGRQYLREQGTEATGLAREMFNRAIALDPAFAQPRAGLADADMTMLQWQLVPSDAEAAALGSEALSASNEAPGSIRMAEAHVARANVLSLSGRNDEADQSLRRGHRAQSRPA